MTNFLKHKMRRKSAGEIIGWVILGIILVSGLAILFGFLIMWLWNWLMPAIFGLPTLSYWQAVGIFILAKFIFGFGGCGGGGGHKGKHSGHRKHRCNKGGRNDFSKWEHYDKFWEVEGEKAFNEYLGRMHPREEDEEHE